MHRPYQPPPDEDPVIELAGPDGTQHLRRPRVDQVAATLSRFVSAARAGQTVDETSCLRQIELLEAVLDRHVAARSAP